MNTLRARLDNVFAALIKIGPCGRVKHLLSGLSVLGVNVDDIHTRLLQIKEPHGRDFISNSLFSILGLPSLLLVPSNMRNRATFAHSALLLII